MSNGQFITADIQKKIEGNNLTVMDSHAAFKLFMDEEFVDLSKDVQEQPWCSVCMEFSDYRRKWQSLPRADLEGGTYSENTESPYCVGCGSLMYDLKDSRNLLFFYSYAFSLFYDSRHPNLLLSIYLVPWRFILLVLLPCSYMGFSASARKLKKGD